MFPHISHGFLDVWAVLLNLGVGMTGSGWHHGAHTPDGDWANRGVDGEAAPAWRFSKEIMGGGVVIDGGGPVFASFPCDFQ